MHDADPVTCAASGAIAHPALVAHSAGYAPRVHQVNDRVWCAVGYGLAIVFLTPWLAKGLAHFNNFTLSPVLLLVFFIIGILADRS